MKRFYGSISCFPEYKISKTVNSSILCVLPDEKRKSKFVKNTKSFLRYFKKSIPVFSISSDTESIENRIRINTALYALIKKETGIFSITPEVLNIHVPEKETFLDYVISIHSGHLFDRDELIQRLVKIGFLREENPENQGEFSVKGGIVSVHIPHFGIVDIDFFGDTIENIFLYSKLGTRKKIEKVEILPLDIYAEKTVPIKNYFREMDICYIDVHNEVLGKGKFYFIEKGSNPEISKQIYPEKKIKLPITSPLFLSDGTAFLPEEEKYFSFEVETLKEGDYIIHEDYGIGIFRGIETRQIKGKSYDFMVLEYANNEKIYVSYLHFNKIFKYRSDGSIALDQIGGTSWRNLKKKVKSSLKKIAYQLVRLYSERQRIKREPLDIDNELIKMFEETFPYVETPDQKRAIQDVKKDLSSEKPMERVICGDVGFGKTEVALRAVFINAVNGKQSLVLTPTTVLSYQHYRNFKERLEPFGIKVENLSRLKSKKNVENILKELKEGKIDVLIGTHKALQDHVKFKQLGLLVIDEEHRFGVRAKEKIRELKKDIDTLYMTATPIPRTLNMALSGLKDMSVINTPPEGRLETKTYVLPFSEKKVVESIKRELKRGGQVFYIYNRIEGIEEKVKWISSLFPDRKVSYAHGKMKPKQIEKVLLDFIQKKIDILVSTSIIETGIDIPSANTLIIENADLFGLAQLYHLRGRVGRGSIQAYCYLFIPEKREITKDAEKRLSTIKRLTRPGSGLKISIEDMQIRGVGNILGVEQSGHIKAVGYEMYMKLLKEAINEEIGRSEKEPVITFDFESFIPEDFIEDKVERMNIYMAVSKADSAEEIENIKRYLEQFYSGLPEAFKMYLEISKIKKSLSGKGIEKIEIKKPLTVLYFNDIDTSLLEKIIKNMSVKQISDKRIEIYINRVEDLTKILT